MRAARRVRSSRSGSARMAAVEWGEAGRAPDRSRAPGAPVGGGLAGAPRGRAWCERSWLGGCRHGVPVGCGPRRHAGPAT